RVTPLRVSSPTIAPANTPQPVRPRTTLLGSSVTVTPARGVPIVPRAPAAPATPPSQFAVGSRTQIPPVPPTPPVAPLRVRFVTPSAAPPPPPARMPTGTTPIANEAQVVARREWREDFVRGFVYALLVAAVAIGVYLLA
ncbi:MAG TPA: hypothetical protein VFS15_15120, partial [Kofleriaceae bacterium]|nr:hypothetical protein [Kofleriaceae bacterium]